MQLRKKSSGFSLIEIIVAIFILALATTALVGGIQYAEGTAKASGNTVRANFLAEEGLEATRNIRDAGYTNLVNGTYGMLVSGNVWTFSGASDTTGIFTRAVTIATVDTITKKVTSTVTWTQKGRAGSVSLVTYMTNMSFFSMQSNNLVVNTSTATLGGTNSTEVQNVGLMNGGTSAITITAITTTWNNLTSSLKEIDISTTKVWSTLGPGTPLLLAPTGTTVNIQNYTIPTGTTVPLKLIFTGNMTGNNFGITFTFSDGSTKTVTYP